MFNDTKICGVVLYILLHICALCHIVIYCHLFSHLLALDISDYEDAFLLVLKNVDVCFRRTTILCLVDIFHPSYISSLS